MILLLLTPPALAASFLRPEPAPVLLVDPSATGPQCVEIEIRRPRAQLVESIEGGIAASCAARDRHLTLCLSPEGTWPEQLPNEISCMSRSFDVVRVDRSEPVVSIAMNPVGPVSSFTRGRELDLDVAGRCWREDGRPWQGVEEISGRGMYGIPSFGVAVSPGTTPAVGFCGTSSRAYPVEIIAAQ